jgi:hypothetical protein
MLGRLSIKPGHLSFNLFSYNRLDDQRLGTRTQLRGTNDRYTMARLHILSHSV